MKRIILLIAFSCACFAVQAARHALVIGIGNYPATSGWAKINGDKDIPLVEEMLLANGFNKPNIVKLKDEKATCNAIKQAMENMIAKAQQGDYLYIHFSGHGQQITDTNGDESDGLDEAWISYDAQFAYAKGKYEGQNHIVDDQLNNYFHRMREKIGSNGKLVIIADACHSGEGSRGDDDERKYVTRGTSDAFVIPNPKQTTANISYPIQWTFISACKPYQCNYEYKGNGSLTYALYQQRDNFAKLSAKQMGQRVRSGIADLIPFTQTPVLEVAAGKENEIFF